MSEKSGGGTPIVCGGPLPSELINQTLAYDCIDVVSIGEGEYTWCDLAEYYAGNIKTLDEINGIAYKKDSGEVVRTAQRQFIDLAELPPLDWSLIDVTKYFQTNYGCSKMLYLYSAKGCPFSCTFCYNDEFHRCTYRKRPTEILLEEIKTLVTQYGMDGVYFADELWCTGRTEMHEICDKLKGLGLDFVWGCQTRIGIFDADDFKYMFDSGCRWVFFGVESGSKDVLKRINKKLAYDKVEQTFADCKKAGLAAIASFIAGFPDEICEELQDSVNLAKRIDTELINFNYLALVPGATIYNELVANGRYPAIVSLKQLAKENPMERLEYNFSKIPDIDIKVVRAYFMWGSFTAKDVPGNENYGFAKKVITDAIKSVNTGEFFSFIFSTANAGIEFFKTAFYANCFPKIKKKYGLCKNKKV